ncbi:MAG: hypothetical protein QW793_07935 [Candidatus Caldarchaeum sp.]
MFKNLKLLATMVGVVAVLVVGLAMPGVDARLFLTSSACPHS